MMEITFDFVAGLPACSHCPVSSGCCGFPVCTRKPNASPSVNVRGCDLEESLSEQNKRRCLQCRLASQRSPHPHALSSWNARGTRTFEAAHITERFCDAIILEAYRLFVEHIKYLATVASKAGTVNGAPAHLICFIDVRTLEEYIL